MRGEAERGRGAKGEVTWLGWSRPLSVRVGLEGGEVCGMAWTGTTRANRACGLGPGLARRGLPTAWWGLAGPPSGQDNGWTAVRTHAGIRYQTRWPRSADLGARPVATPASYPMPRHPLGRAGKRKTAGPCQAMPGLPAKVRPRRRRRPVQSGGTARHDEHFANSAPIWLQINSYCEISPGS